MRWCKPIFFVFLVLSSLLVNEPAKADDWPNWRGPTFDGISTESIPETLPSSLPVLWTAQVGTGFSTVSVAGDRVVTMGNQDDRDTIWCLDAKTGKMVWKHSYDCALDPLYYEGGPGGTPTIHDGSVYTLSKKGHAFRLDLETGAILWERDLIADHGFKLPEWSFACSPFIDGDRILLNVGRSGLALSRETGETLWMPSTETSGYATVVPFATDQSETSHLLFSAKALIAFDSASGKQFWSHPWKSSRDVNAADPIVLGNQIIVSSSAGTEKISPRRDGSGPIVHWRQHDLKWYFNPGVLIDGYLYSLHGTTHRPTELTCTDVETGKTIWSEEGFGSGGLKAAGNIVIVFDLGKLTLFRASPEGFQPLLQQKVLDGKCWTSPVYSNGQIYCRNAAGELVSLEIPKN